jgi:hypothetical protein
MAVVDGLPPGDAEAEAPSASVTAGHGAVLIGPGTVLERPLPPAVTDLRPLHGTLKPRSQLTWMSVDAAAAYRIQIAEDPQFVRLVYERTVQAPVASVPALPARSYYWRVITVDGDGFHSPPSSLLSFRVPDLAP